MDGGNTQQDQAREREGMSLTRFLAALATSIIIFAVQVTIFLLLRNKLARIFKPKTYLVPERERTDAPPRNPVGLFKRLWTFSDREVINKCGLDAYFFLRYLRTLLIIFVPIALVLIPILLPLNFVSGRGRDLVENDDDSNNSNNDTPTGLDTLTWGNVTPENHNRHWAHLILAILVIIWVCTVFYFELRVYTKVRQDYLTTAEHRLRASATTVLINNVPPKWLTEEALRGLFDVLPGGIRNVWLNRDLSKLLEKINLRDSIHKQLEGAETELIKKAKKNQLKQRKKDEKKSRRRSHAGAPSKEEQERRAREEDERARRLAQSGQGTSAGAHEDVPHDVAQVVEEVQEEDRQRRYSQGAPVEGSYTHDSKDEGPVEGKGRGFGFLGGGIAKVGQGIRGGVGRIGQGVENEVGTTNGFTRIGSSGGDTRPSADHPRIQALRQDNSRIGANSNVAEQTVLEGVSRTESARSRGGSFGSQNSSQAPAISKFDTATNGNTVRQISDLNKMYDNEKRKWYQFWRPPAGGFANPVPQMTAAEENPLNYTEPERTFWQKVLYLIGLGGDDLPPIEYGESSFTGNDYDEKCEEQAVWRQYVKPKDRPRHRLPRWGFPNWLGWLTFGKKVDTIYWCRTELARLNLEIRTDQAHPERYPLMNSAFIQFNEQVSAHMACQSLVHHLPKQMAPRINEISPKDVIWSNMNIKWWDEWARTAAVTTLIVSMAVLWAIPVAWTAALANVDALTETLPWLSWLNENPWKEVGGAVSGILPPALLALLLVLVPIILDLLAEFKGAKTGSQKTEFVQKFFFVFLFIQVFLVVTVTSFFTNTISDFTDKIETLTNIEEVLRILAEELPKAANYFFTYMILQGMSVSSGALLQIGTLLVWYIIARIIDSTARNKWSRNTQLNNIRWGHMFPIYTNFACIALIYCVIAPLISIFAIITFSLLWMAQKYVLVYVARVGVDTGGVLYPRAINQAFTGIYFMELCLAGLFFILVDGNGRTSGTARGIIMLVTVPLTIFYQVLLNRTFSPLARYLPITMEDEAAIRDRVFAEEQRRRFGLADDTDYEGEQDKGYPMGLDGMGPDGYRSSEKEDDEVELRGMTPQPKKKTTFNPVKDVANFARKGGRGLKGLTLDKVEGTAPVKNAAAYRREQRQKDIESQRAIGEALYGGVADEIEDLMPEERNALIIESFKHRALRARQPTVWIPHDDMGVSDDEIRLTKEYTDNVHISNEGTALDSKVRVVYGRNPPDFSEIDLIDL